MTSTCAGYLDASLKLLNSLTAPSIGGDVRISRGVASLMPGAPQAPGSSGGGSSQAGGELPEMRARAREHDLVLKAFKVLTRKDALARQLSRLDVQQVGLRPSCALSRLTCLAQPRHSFLPFTSLCCCTVQHICHCQMPAAVMESTQMAVLAVYQLDRR